MTATPMPAVRLQSHPWIAAIGAMRTGQWLHFCLLPLCGLDRNIAHIAVLPVLLAGISSAACLGFAYGLNAITERASDRSVHKNPLVGAPHGTKPAMILVLAAALFAIMIAAGLTSVDVSVALSELTHGPGIAMGSWALAAVCISLLSGALYSVGLVGKHIPGIGLVLNFGIFAPLTVLLLEPTAPPPTLYVELVLFSCLLICNQLIHERADRHEDAAAGALTTARLLGRRATLLTIAMVGAAGVGACWWLAPSALLGGLAAVTCIVATGVILIQSNAASARLNHRYISLIGGGIVWLSSWH